MNVRQYTPIPVGLGILVQGWEYKGQDHANIIAHQIDNILIVPVIESALGNLEVLAIDTAGELTEQRLLDLDKLAGVNDVENFFDLVKEHDFLWTVDLGPVAKQTTENLFGETRVLFKELDDAVCELGMVERQRLDLVQGNEHTGEEHLVLFLEGERKAVDDGAKDLEKLCDAIMTLSLIDELEKDIVDGSTDKRAKIEEFAVDTV